MARLASSLDGVLTRTFSTAVVCQTLVRSHRLGLGSDHADRLPNNDSATDALLERIILGRLQSTCEMVDGGSCVHPLSHGHWCAYLVGDGMSDFPRAIFVDVDNVCEQTYALLASGVGKALKCALG